MRGKRRRCARQQSLVRAAGACGPVVRPHPCSRSDYRQRSHPRLAPRRSRCRAGPCPSTPPTLPLVRLQGPYLTLPQDRLAVLKARAVSPGTPSVRKNVMACHRHRPLRSWANAPPSNASLVGPSPSFEYLVRPPRERRKMFPRASVVMLLSSAPESSFRLSVPDVPEERTR